MTEARKPPPDAGCNRAKAEGDFLALAAGDALGWPQEFDWERVRPKNPPVSANFYEWARLCDGWFGPQEVIRAGEYSDANHACLRTLIRPFWKPNCCRASASPARAA